ncbi:MAG: hypothetical protein HEQ38_06785 [Gemmatimonas sp.]|nr:hypothetical protein [Gemmatimonas sp.]
MTRWSARLRRAATLVFSVHLLQLVLLAASAACELGASAPHGPSQHGVAQHPPTHGGHHSPQHSQQQDQSPDASCPMAMACSATGVVVEIETITTRVDVVTPVPVLSLDVDTPTSVRPAPETPPPRA